MARLWKIYGFRLGTLELALVLFALIPALIALDSYANSGEIYRGVKVAGVSVGGETPREARKIVEERIARETPEEIRLVAAGESVTLNSEELEINFQPGTTIDRAYEVGRKGWIGHRLSERLQATFGGIELHASTKFDTELVRGVVGDLANIVNEEPRDAVILMSDTRAQVQNGVEGYRVDQDATLQNVRVAIGNLESKAKVAGEPVAVNVSTEEAKDAAGRINKALAEPLIFEHGDQSWQLSPGDVRQLLTVEDTKSGLDLGVDASQLETLLPEMYQEVRRPPRDASFTFVDGEIEVKPEQPGQQVAQKKLANELQSGIFSGQHTFQVPVNEEGQPELTAKEAEKLKPTKMLGRFKTNYEIVDDPDGNRTYNLDIAAKAINETVLAPGEVFSVNDKVSQLDYREAKVFQEGLIQYADGGGLCQVASTLYVAATRAGLEIVERHPHYATLEYIKPGFDSTVWFGDAYGNGELDSRFKNTTDGYVLLREWVDEDGNMYAEVWGQPNDTRAELRSERVDYDNSTSTWVTYKKVFKNGEMVEEKRAYKDTYRSVGDNENYDENKLFDPVWEP